MNKCNCYSYGSNVTLILLKILKFLVPDSTVRTASYLIIPAYSFLKLLIH